MGKAKEGRLSPSVSLFPITAPRATKERQRETSGDESAALLQAKFNPRTFGFQLTSAKRF